MLSLDHIKEMDKTYQEQIKQLQEQVEYQQRRNQRQDKEIKRLNNIINELEKCIYERIIRTKKEPIREKERNRILYNLAHILDKLEELKGSVSNE